MPRKLTNACLAAAVTLAGASSALAQQTEVLLGQLTLFPYMRGGQCPEGWSPANGQTLNVSSNQALFSLIGNIYGGNGTTTFNLPDLRGRAPIHYGQGAGLPNYPLAQTGGATSATLTVSNLPAMQIQSSGNVPSHSAQATIQAGNLPSVQAQVLGSSNANTQKGPGGNYLATFAGNFYANPQGTPTTALAGVSASYSGTGTPLNISIPSTQVTVSGAIPGSGTAVATQSPYIAMVWCIATQGIYPMFP